MFSPFPEYIRTALVFVLTFALQIQIFRYKWNFLHPHQKPKQKTKKKKQKWIKTVKKMKINRIENLQTWKMVLPFALQDLDSQWSSQGTCKFQIAQCMLLQSSHHLLPISSCHSIPKPPQNIIYQNYI